MPKRSDNIHKRKDGRWEGRCRVGLSKSGKPKYVSVYGSSYAEVKEKLMYEYKTIGEDNCRTKNESSFREAVIMWSELKKVKIKGSTIAKYDYLINHHILPQLGDYKISHITAVVLNRFMIQKLDRGRLDEKGGLSASYVRTIMLIISSVMDFAVAEQMCPPLRTQIYKPPAGTGTSDLQVLSVVEQRKLEQFLECEINNTKLGVLISLHTGMRIGEVCALEWNAIDFEQKTIHVRYTVTRIKNEGENASGTKLIIDKPKTKTSTRDIPISSRLLKNLKKVSVNNDSKYVIADGGTKFVSPRTYEYRYHNLLEECGISKINYHALRHTFATRCIEVGVDVKTLSEILGHANVSITLNTYVHSSMDLKRSQIEKLVTVAV